MANAIQVLVEDKETHNQSTLTYKAYLDVQSRFILIGQVDDNGQLIPGDPNLQPQHRKAPVKSEVAAVDKGHKFDSPILTKVLNQSAKEIEGIFNDRIHNEIQSSPIVIDSPPINYTLTEVGTVIEDQPIGIERSEELNTQQPVKVRNKPGPKPKIKE